MLNLINSDINSTINSKNIYYYVSNNIDGSKDYEFLLSIISLFDKVFTEGDVGYLSREQKTLLNNYLNEADNKLSEINEQLDDYLGGFLGETNEIYFTK